VSPAEPSLLFVYGTLMRGQRNHAFLDAAQYLGRVRTAASYTLVSLGPFPALREGGSAAVEGELYEVDGAILADLDQLEGHPNFYRRDAVLLADGRPSVTYFLPPGSHPGAEKIDHWP
jgi:gamma-glutamylaminecyclotransferase